MPGAHIHERHRYLAGGDRERAADFLAAVVDDPAIRAVLAECAQRLDAADPTWVDTFTPDGVFEVVDAATGHRLHRQEGHADLTRYVAGAPRPPNCRQHVVTNLVIDVDGDEAHVESYWQLLERDGDGHPILVACPQALPASDSGCSCT